jgi:hypothetical protein
MANIGSGWLKKHREDTHKGLKERNTRPEAAFLTSPAGERSSETALGPRNGDRP